MTDVKTYLDPAEEKMEMAVAYLDEALAHIRAGKANPKILDGIRVEYYGSAAPISNVANVSVPDARTIIGAQSPSLHGKNRCSRRLRKPSSIPNSESHPKTTAR